MHKIHALKTAIAAIKNGILHLSPNSAHLSAIEDSLKIEIELPYRYAVPIQVKIYQLADFFANCRDDAEWQFDFDSSALELKNQDWEARIPVESSYPERSPEQLTIDCFQTLKLSILKLKAAFYRVRYAVKEKDPDAPNQRGLDSIHLFYEQGLLWLTATDGVRIAMEAIATNSKEVENVELGLDPDLLEKVLRILPSTALASDSEYPWDWMKDRSPTEVEIEIRESSVQFLCGGVKVSCPKGSNLKLYSSDRAFTHLTKFFAPKNFTVEIDRDRLLAAALRAEAIPSGIHNPIFLDICSNCLTLYREKPKDRPLFRERICEVDAPDVLICLRADYLIELLRAATGGIIAMRFNCNADQTDPVVWESGDLRQLLMPIRAL